ncbi:hypothetical protein [Bordetella ansorpii]|uniref:hypothetical protein n=1 Tax=Bordetella ansorpii TaxID=288768 RepID=UPI000B064AEE|nr:hypothetical protein [Bordetella ansorpii]
MRITWAAPPPESTSTYIEYGSARRPETSGESNHEAAPAQTGLDALCFDDITEV